MRDFILKGKIKRYVSVKENSEQQVKVIKYFWLLWLKFLFSNAGEPTIIHYHTSYWKYRALLSLLSKLRPISKTILTVHSMREEKEDLAFNTKFYLRYAAKNAPHFLVTNKDIRNKLINWGANKNKITVISPFIPPVENESANDSLSQDVRDFLENKFPIITANASQFTFHNNEDAYGFDLSIELCKKLKKVHPNFGFVFMLPGINNEKYFKSLNDKLDEYGLRKNFMFFVKPVEFYPLLKMSDIFLRPTNTDGDAISIREALHLGIPSVASDCVARPNSTLLFKNRDTEDLNAVMLKLIGNLDQAKKELQQRKSKSALDEIISIYKGLLNLAD